MLASVLHTASYDLRTSRMIIGNYTADVSVGETAPSPTSPEPWCLKDTIRGGRVLDGGDACQVSEGESPEGVGTGSSELSRDEALDIVDMLRSSAGGRLRVTDTSRVSMRRVWRNGVVAFVGVAVASRPRQFPGGSPPHIQAGPCFV